MHERGGDLQPTYDLAKHFDQVQGCAVTGDGSLVLTASDDETVLVWDLHPRASVRLLVDSTEQVFGVATSRDGSRAATASKNGEVRFWHVDDGTCVARLAASEELFETSAVWANDCWLSDDGTLAVGVFCSASRLSQIAIFKWAPDGRVSERRSMMFRDRVLSLAASVASNTLAFSAPSTRAVHLVDLETFEERRCVPLADVTCLPGVAAAANAPAIAVADSAQLRVLHPSDPGADVILTGYEAAERRTPCAINADGSRVVAACAGATFGVWDVETGARLTMLAAHPVMATACAMSADATRVITGYEDGLVRSYDTSEYGVSVANEADFALYYFRTRFGAGQCDLDSAIYGMNDLLREQGLEPMSVEVVNDALTNACDGKSSLKITQMQFIVAFAELRPKAKEDVGSLRDRWCKLFDRYAASSADSSLIICASGKLLIMQIFNKLHASESEFSSANAVELLRKHAKNSMKIFQDEFVAAAEEAASMARKN